jgi:hypothetical protein
MKILLSPGQVLNVRWPPRPRRATSAGREANGGEEGKSAAEFHWPTNPNQKALSAATPVAGQGSISHAMRWPRQSLQERRLAQAEVPGVFDIARRKPSFDILD